MRAEVISAIRPQDRYPAIFLWNSTDRLTGRSAGAPTITYQGTTVTIAVDANVNEYASFENSQVAAPPLTDNWECYIFMSGAITADAAITVFAGLCDNIAAGLLPTGAARDFAGIRVDNANVIGVNGDGAAETTTNLTVSGGHTTGNSFLIRRTGSSIFFFVNGTLRATHTTNLPNGGNGNLYLIVDSSGAGAAIATAVIFGTCAAEEVN